MDAQAAYNLPLLTVCVNNQLWFLSYGSMEKCARMSPVDAPICTLPEEEGGRSMDEARDIRPMYCGAAEGRWV